jgi:hypothetical protein
MFLDFNLVQIVILFIIILVIGAILIKKNMGASQPTYYGPAVGADEESGVVPCDGPYEGPQ